MSIIKQLLLGSIYEVFELSQQVQFFLFLFFLAYASNVGSPTKFVACDNAKVSVFINLLYVIVFETKIKDKRAKLIFLPGSK